MVLMAAFAGFPGGYSGNHSWRPFGWADRSAQPSRLKSSVFDQAICNTQMPGVLFNLLHLCSVGAVCLLYRLEQV